MGIFLCVRCTPENCMFALFIHRCACVCITESIYMRGSLTPTPTPLITFLLLVQILNSTPNPSGASEDRGPSRRGHKGNAISVMVIGAVDQP